jgi:hypothetical protein
MPWIPRSQIDDQNQLSIRPENQNIPEIFPKKVWLIFIHKNFVLFFEKSFFF